MNLILKFKLILNLVLLSKTILTFSLSTEKSLFDDLPLNGAYAPLDTLSHNSSSLNVMLKSENSAETKNVSLDQTQLAKKLDSLESNSLFDSLPNQGAMKEHVFESKPFKRGVFTNSEVLDFSLSPNSDVRFQIELEKLKPSSSKDNFHQKSLSQSINRVPESPKLHTVLSPPIVQVINGDSIKIPQPKPISNNLRLYNLPPPNRNQYEAKKTMATSIIYGTPVPNLKKIENKESEPEYYKEIIRTRPRNRQEHLAQKNRDNYRNHKGLYANNANNNNNNSPIVPIITGRGRRRGGYGPSNSNNNVENVQITTSAPLSPSSTNSPISNDGLTGDYDYENLEETKDPKFGARTGHFFSSSYDEPSNSYRAPSQDSKSYYSSNNNYNNNQQKNPSELYGPPQESYGPPAIEGISDSGSHNNNNGPSEIYGPPKIRSTTQPPPQIQQIYIPAPPPASPSSTTSISYQTIPIQTISTQLVTVPQITVSASDPGVDSSRPQSASRPNRPSNNVDVGITAPQNGYGPPKHSKNTYSGSGGNNNFNNGEDDNSEMNERGSVGSLGGLFTDEQLALLISASRGFGTNSGNGFESDPLSLIAQGGGRVNGNFLNLNQGSNNVGVQQFPILGLGGTSLLDRTRLTSPNNLNIFSQPLNFPIRNLNANPGLSSLNQFQLGSNSQISLASLLSNQQDQRASLSGLRAPNDLNLLNLGSSGIRTGPVLTGDAIGALNDILREEKLRGAVSDLRGRLRVEGRRGERARQNYRSLFVKGALLLSALTLLPTVATPFAAAASGLSAPNFLLPLAGKRRRRETQSGIENEIRLKLEKCRSLVSANETFFSQFIDCVGNETEWGSEGSSGSSIFDSMPFQGALVPESIRADLEKWVPKEEIVKNSECLQKKLCETLIEIEELPESEKFIKLYSTLFSNDFKNNHWIREALTAGRNRNCRAFYCYEATIVKQS